MKDTYQTIIGVSEAEFVEKRSRFISFAHFVKDEEGAEEWVSRYRKKYNDARHVCYAYRIGKDYECYRENDDGEPSGTAGKPILGRIDSHNLTFVLIVVIRYFGGIKLGTGGLVTAYQEAAEKALEGAKITTKVIGEVLAFRYPYAATNEINQILHGIEYQLINEAYGEDCLLELKVRKREVKKVREALLSHPEVAFLAETKI